MPASVFRKRSQSMTGRKFAFPLGSPLSIVSHKSPRRIGLGEMYCTLKRRLDCTVGRKVPEEIKAAERTQDSVGLLRKLTMRRNLLTRSPVAGRPEGGPPECDFTRLQFTVFNIKRIRSPRVIRGIRCCRPSTRVSRSCSTGCGCHLPI